MHTSGERSALRLQEGKPGRGLVRRDLAVVTEALRMRLDAIAVQWRWHRVLAEGVETLTTEIRPARLRREDRLNVCRGKDLSCTLQVRCHVGLPVACEERMAQVVTSRVLRLVQL